jgi:hypothetical protein
MAYIGNNLTVQQYAPTIKYFSGNGSTTVFTLPIAVITAEQIIVVVANVPQNPSSAYTVNGTTLTFTSAPPTGTNNIWVEYTSLTTAVSIPPSGYSEFASGTAILFQQTAAPTGWTKSTSYNNYALRVVSGTAGTGGTVAFTTAFASQTPAGSVAISGSVDGTTLSSAQIPSHTHVTNIEYMDPIQSHNHGSQGGYVMQGSNQYGGRSTDSGTNQYTGGGGSHSHTVSGVSGSFTGTAINLAVQYVDAIICTKN